MRKLTIKNKFILQVVLGFLFSGLVYIKVLWGNKRIDEIAAGNFEVFLALFISIVLASLFINYIFVCLKDKIFENPGNLENLLRILNYQVALFALMYFFMDTLFDNVYIKMPLHVTQNNQFVNISILIIFFIVYKLKNKDCTMRQLIKVIVVFALLALQLNYIEILFFSCYFTVLLILEKNKSLVSKWINTYKIHGEDTKKIVIGALFVFLNMFSRDVYGLMTSMIIMIILLYIAYQSQQAYFNI